MDSVESLSQKNAANSENAQDIINSNISVINLMREEKLRMTI
jgi:hypothetical protein